MDSGVFVFLSLLLLILLFLGFGSHARGIFQTLLLLGMRPHGGIRGFGFGVDPLYARLNETFFLGL